MKKEIYIMEEFLITGLKFILKANTYKIILVSKFKGFVFCYFQNSFLRK